MLPLAAEDSPCWTRRSNHPMDFRLNEEQQLIRDTAKRIAHEVIAPRAAELDETGEYPEDIFQVYKESGLLGLTFPEQYGGSGAGPMGLGPYCSGKGKTKKTTSLILL